MSRSTALSRPRSRKAQASMEFMALFILFLVAITFAMYVSIQRSAVIADAQISLESNKVLTSMTNKINTVYIEGDGFSMNVTLPERIFKINYTVSINSNEVILRIDGSSFIEQVITNNITGSFEKGTSRVTNNNNEIIVEWLE